MNSLFNRIVAVAVVMVVVGWGGVVVVAGWVVGVGVGGWVGGGWGWGGGCCFCCRACLTPSSS